MKRFLAPLLAVLAVAALVFVLLPKDAEAQAPGKPAFSNIMGSGVDAWRSGNASSAIRRWVDQSPLAKDEAYIRRLETELGAVTRAYGRPRSYETIHSVDLTTNIRLTYLGVHLENGPFFMRFLSYRKSRGNWIISEIDYNVQVDPLLTPLIQKAR